MSLFSVKTYGPPSGKPIFLLGGWNTKHQLYWPTTLYLTRYGFYCISYSYDPNILRPDVYLTTSRIRIVHNSILAHINNLKQTGQQEVSIFGTSLGGTIAMLVAKNSPRVTKLILSVPAFDLARIIWNWNADTAIFRGLHIRRQLSFKKLKKKLEPIEPLSYLDSLTNKKVLLYLSEKDTVTPCRIEQIDAELTQHGINHHLVVHKKMGHVLAATINPFDFNRQYSFLAQDEFSSRSVRSASTQFSR